MRVTHHLAMLSLLGVMTLSSVSARWSETATPVVLVAAAPTPIINTSAPNVFAPQSAPVGSGGNLPLSAAPSPTAQAAQSSTNVIAVVPPPAADVPRNWVQNFRPTDVFDGPGPQAASLGSVGQFTTLELVEQSDAGRSKLFDPGRGEGRLPGFVWANLGDFGPSGPPKYLYELAKDGATEAIAGRRVPERTTTAWPPLPNGESAVMLDGESGALLYAKSAHARLPQASTTKIMTALVALENGKLDDRVTVDVNSEQLYLTTESTVMGLMPGQTVTLETLLYGLMLSSGNDAAIAIAKHVGGSEARFIEMMNAKAKAMDLRDTQFKNPHGLDADGHYSSAFDLAAMARYGFRNPTFYSLSMTRHWNADGFDLWNLNKLLNAYPGADGVKPGFTDAAGRCLVGSAVRDGRRVFVVVLKSADPTGDSRGLLDYAFDGFRWPT